MTDLFLNHECDDLMARRRVMMGNHKPPSPNPRIPA